MFQSTFAEDNTSMEGMKLLDVINTVKPTILIGLSGCGGIFTGQLRLNLSRENGRVKRSEVLRILIDITSPKEDSMPCDRLGELSIGDLSLRRFVIGPDF